MNMIFCPSYTSNWHINYHRMATTADVLTAPVAQKMVDPIHGDIAELAQIPPVPQLKSMDSEKLKQMYTQAKSINILMTGKTDSGKSTLINGILGLKISCKTAVTSSSVAEDSSDCMTKVAATKYQVKKGEVDVTVWDSPGLQDGIENQDEYLQQMRTECAARDLTLYCISVVSMRRLAHGYYDDNPDVLAMRMLTQTYGTAFWNNAVIVLTFANTLQLFNLHWRRMPIKRKAQAFKLEIQEWEEKIQTILIHNLKVPVKIAKAVKLIPAGNCEKLHLPGNAYWLSALWFHCLNTIPTPEKQLTLVKITADRLRKEEEVTRDDFNTPSEEQPIVIRDDIVALTNRLIRGVGLGMIAGAAGGITGGLLTMGLGSFCGMGIGLVAAYLTFKR